MASSSISNSITTNTENPDPKASVMQSRIISHMNADHAASLRLYLRHYCQVPESWMSGNPVTFEEVTTSHMIISSGSNGKTRNLIPFTPPLNSLSESRERLVQMHNDALKGLGVSDTIVRQYVPPNRLYQWTFMIACLWIFTTLPIRSKVHPDSNSFISLIYSLGGMAPELAKAFHRVQPAFLGVLLVLHGAEAVTMARTRLRKHQVEPLGRLWWMWVADTFVEGFGAFDRFDELVKKVEGKKKREEKH